MVIVGNESAILTAIEIEAAKRTEQYALALIPNRYSRSEVKPILQPQRDSSSSEIYPVVIPSAYSSLEKVRIPLDWSPGSPISARTLVLAAENRLGPVDTAILVCDPPSACGKTADLNFADVEVLVNDHIKGWFLLIKELAAFFRARGEGTLALVFSEPGGKDETAELFGPAALASFRSLTGSLLAAAHSEP
jgi:hypothetical protein